MMFSTDSVNNKNLETQRNFLFKIYLDLFRYQMLSNLTSENTLLGLPNLALLFPVMFLTDSVHTKGLAT